MIITRETALSVVAFLVQEKRPILASWVSELFFERGVIDRAEHYKTLEVSHDVTSKRITAQSGAVAISVVCAESPEDLDEQ